MSQVILSPAPLEGGFASELRPGAPEPADRLPAPLPEHRARYKHAAVASIASLLILAVLAVIGAHGYIAWTLAHPYVAPLVSNPMQAKNLDYYDITFPSVSGKTTVDGWYIPSAADEGRTIVFSHGYGANREEAWVPMYDLAALLHRLRYNVLMFDYGYASEKNRTPATGGIEESQQLLGAIRYAKAQGAEDIVVWGFSMGAGTALQAALQTDEIDAMILDSMFITDADTLYHNLTQFLPLPRNPSVPLIASLLPLWSGVELNEIPADRVKRTTYDMPIYMIHGTRDAKAPTALAETVASNQTHPLSGLWVVEGGQHEMLFRIHPNEYMQRALIFLSQVHSMAT